MDGVSSDPSRLSGGRVARAIAIGRVIFVGSARDGVQIPATRTPTMFDVAITFLFLCIAFAVIGVAAASWAEGAGKY